VVEHLASKCEALSSNPHTTTENRFHSFHTWDLESIQDLNYSHQQYEARAHVLLPLFQVLKVMPSYNN
jgi:hypothetical protein